MKKTLTVATAIVLALALAAPVFASDMTHNATYKMEGDIELESQVGHLCNTGAQWNQEIDGEGEMTKVKDTHQVAGKLTVDDQQDWVTAEDAVRNLTVTSAIQLCAPGKHEYEATKYELNNDDVWLTRDVADGVLPPIHGYAMDWGDAYEYLGTGDVYLDLFDLVLAEGGLDQDELMAEIADDDTSIEDVAADELADGFIKYEPSELTDQVWAAQVEADPGFSGNLHQDFEVAYGPFGGWYDWPIADLDDGYLGYDDDDGVTDIPEWGDDYWFFQEDEDEVWSVVKGDDYVGNYFNMDQMARTSQGTTKRYIDVSSPWSGAYLHEDMTVEGMAEIEETFGMDNLEPGEEAVPDWWDIF